MKTLTIHLLLILSFVTNAKTFKLNYEPKGQIVKFLFDSLTIYTDTTSLFLVYFKEGDLKDYDLRVKNFILRAIKEVNSDTVTFSGTFIPFNDGIENKYQKDWYVEWAILHLIKEKKLKMYDKRGQIVKTIVTKKVGKKKKGFVKRSYKDKATNEELLSETLFNRIVNPPF